MAEAERRIAITRRVDLEHIADDWAGVYAVVTLASFQEKADLSAKDLSKMTDAAATEFMRDVVVKHFVSGKIPIFTDDGSTELVDMQAADLAASVTMINDVYLVVMGVTLDPKVMRTLMESSPTQPGTSEPSAGANSTKT